MGNNNNDENMVYVNADPTGGHFDSSTATLTLPAGATVERAFLYWAADLSQGVNRTPVANPPNPPSYAAPGGDSVANNKLYTTVQMRVGAASYSTINAADPARNGQWAHVALPQRGGPERNGEEGTFVICSFWLVSALAKAGEIERAEHLFDQLAGYANDLGLLAEEIDTAMGSSSLTSRRRSAISD